MLEFIDKFINTDMSDTTDWASIAQVAIPIFFGAVSGLLASMYKLGQYEQKIKRLEEDVKELKGDMKTNNTLLTECSTKLEERTANQPNRYLKRKSPLALTEEGENLLKKMQGDKFILENQESLMEKIKQKVPKSAYDVQEYSKEIIKDLNDKDEFIPFKDFAFKEGLDIDLINSILGVYFRDIALPLLGYKPSDVDKHDPNFNNDLESTSINTPISG